MERRKPLTDDEGEVRELTQEDFAQFIPFSALPADLQELLSSPKHASPNAEVTSNQQSAA
jgi:hypothetical protein